ncbi:nucleoside deaminase [Corynebacterium glucuronolyticum]
MVLANLPRERREQRMRAVLDLLTPPFTDVPVAAAVFDAEGTMIGWGTNERKATSDPTAHAEVQAIRMAARARRDYILENTELVVTLEPCTMCAGAFLAARIPSLVFGAFEEKTGAVGSVIDVVREPALPNRVEVVGGVLADDCAAPLRAFFRDKRHVIKNVVDTS